MPTTHGLRQGQQHDPADLHPEHGDMDKEQSYRNQQRTFKVKVLTTWYQIWDQKVDTIKQTNYGKGEATTKFLFPTDARGQTTQQELGGGGEWRFQAPHQVLRVTTVSTGQCRSLS